MDRRKQILSKIESIPALPSASAEVIRLVRDLDTSSSEIARAIEFDPSLTANVLRLANSAYFGFVQSVKTVKDALVRLGRNRIFQMVMATLVKKMANRPVKGYDLASGELWDHLIGTAIGSTRLAEALNLKAPDHTFTAAIMHDVGKIVLGMFVEVDAAPITELAFKEKISFELAEKQILGIDHAEIGALLLEHWNLPQELAEVVRWHHKPEDVPAEDAQVVNLVHVADMLCLMAGIGKGIDGLNYRPSKHVVSQLGLRRKIAEAVVYKIISELDEVRSLFK